MIDLNIDHYEPKHHVRMDMDHRAAQFAPFAALTGFDEVIDSKNIININKKILSNDIKNELDDKLHLIENNLSKEIEITYFDINKYIKIKSYIKKIDKINKKIILVNKTIIDCKNILDIKIL